MCAVSRAFLIAAVVIVPIPPSAQSGEIDFTKDIAPIFEQHCLKCHGPMKQQGGLRFDSASGAIRKGDSDEPAIVKGNAEASELIQRVTSDDEFTRMPPEGNGLSAGQIALLKRWIDAGADWPELETAALKSGELVVAAEDREHWSFRPLRHSGRDFCGRQKPVPVGLYPGSEQVWQPDVLFSCDAGPQFDQRIADAGGPSHRTDDSEAPAAVGV